MSLSACLGRLHALHYDPSVFWPLRGRSFGYVALKLSHHVIRFRSLLIQASQFGRRDDGAEQSVGLLRPSWSSRQ